MYISKNNLDQWATAYLKIQLENNHLRLVREWWFHNTAWDRANIIWGALVYQQVCSKVYNS